MNSSAMLNTLFTLTRGSFIGLFFLLFAAISHAQTPVERHGALAVKGSHIIGAHGEPVSLAGPSFFWSNTGWGAEKYYDERVVNYMVKEWNATIIRAAIGAEGPGGYWEDPEGNYARAKTLIDAAIAHGVYILVDWHAHHAEAHPQNAIDFFTRIAKEYGNTPNVIYEIYNEPLNFTSWEDVIKPYAERVTDAIRAIDNDNLIVIGTQTWSQDVDKAADLPLTGYSNIVYTLHFYAGTHKQELRDKATYAIEKGLALMVTEWGTVNANGDGKIAKESTQQWLAFMKQHKLSFCTWSLHDKREGASILKRGASNDGDWTDRNLTRNGRYLKNIISNW